jgi:hypothetical protein
VPNFFRIEPSRPKSGPRPLLSIHILPRAITRTGIGESQEKAPIFERRGMIFVSENQDGLFNV